LSGESGSRIEGTEQRIDGFLRHMSERRQEAIRRSMSRSLWVEIGRTAYLVVCVLVDVVLLPVSLESVIGRYWLAATPVLLIPLCYAQYRLHRRWFVSPFGDPPSQEP
jgi:hypothetical protein